MADSVTGYTDFRRGEDGQVSALKHVEGREPERVNVKVTVDAQVRRASGALEPARRVASSDPADGVGAVRVAA